MKQDPDTDPNRDISAEEMLRRTEPGNRILALVLIGVTFVFLAAAFGVAALVAYGPY